MFDLPLVVAGSKDHYQILSNSKPQEERPAQKLINP